MNLPNPSPDSTEKFNLPGQEKSEDKITQDTSEQSPSRAEHRAPLGGQVEQNLTDPNKLGNSPDPSVASTTDSGDDSTTDNHSADDATLISADQTTQTQSGPAMADDVDVIEKEWVDRAKQIIEQTKDDPYRQEQEVEKLQQDYLYKRYGKRIKSAS